MAKKRKPDDMVDMKVRFQEAFRARLEQEAKKNNRSINGEIVYRLGTTFGAEGVALAGEFEKHEREVAKKFREVVERMIVDARKKG